MTTTVRLRNDPIEDESALQDAATVLKRGGLVAFPTETVYGLGANALDEQAIDRIFEAKGRPANNPLIVHVPGIVGIMVLVGAWPDAADRLVRQFWPGPLTLVLPKRPIVPDIVTAGQPTVALRAPAHPVAQRLLRLAGIPLAAPSANRSGELSPTTAEHVNRSLDGRIDLILDAGPTQVGLESTVLSLAESPPRLLRPGHITPAQIEAVIGPIARGAAAVDNGHPLPSPGLLARHYAPRTPTEVCEGSGWERAYQLLESGSRVAWLTHAPDPRPVEGVFLMRMPAEPAAYATRLYAALHDLDQLGLDRIVVDLPPATEEWLAVRDRLRRAAT